MAHSERMLALLAFLSKDPRRAYTVGEAARGAGIPSGTISALINRLIAAGLAERDEEGPLGTRPFKLTRAGISNARNAAAPARPAEVLSQVKSYSSLAEVAAAVERGEETPEFYERARQRIYGES